MPIVDWTRTQLDFKLPTDGLALKFNYQHIIIFETFILKLNDVDSRYSSKEIRNAEKTFKKMNKKDIENLKIAVMGGLPASEKKYSINEFKKMIYAYRNYQKKNCKKI